MIKQSNNRIESVTKAEHNKFIIADHLRNVIRWVLVVFLTFSLLLSSFVISNIAHEYIHMSDFKSQNVKVEQVCFLGMHGLPYDADTTAIGWVMSTQRTNDGKEAVSGEQNPNMIQAIVFCICFFIDVLIIILFNKLLKRATTKT